MSRHFLISARVTTLLSLLSFVCAASAEDFLSRDFIKQGDETLTINLGGIVNQFGTSVQLNGSTLAGSTIDLENNGLKQTQTSFNAFLTWRFLSRNRIDVLYFGRSDRVAGPSIANSNISGVVVPVNSTVSIDATDDFLDIDYRFSFVKSDDVEIAGLLGVYGGQFKYQVSATRPFAGGGQETLVNTNVLTTVPLPLIGGSVDWYINPHGRLPRLSRV